MMQSPRTVGTAWTEMAVVDWDRPAMNQLYFGDNLDVLRQYTTSYLLSKMGRARRPRSRRFTILGAGIKRPLKRFSKLSSRVARSPRPCKPFARFSGKLTSWPISR